MSLLIKALDKAQAEKAQAKNALKDSGKKESASPEQKPLASAGQAEISTKESGQNVDTPLDLSAYDLSLSPVEKESGIKTEIPEASVQLQKAAPENNLRVEVSTKPDLPQKATAASQQQNAANVFYAKRDVDQSQNIKLAIAVGLTIVALFGLGLYYYLALSKVNSTSNLPKNIASNILNIPSNKTTESPETPIATQLAQVDQAQSQAAATSHEESLGAMPKTTNVFATAKSPPMMDGYAEQAKLLPQHDQINAVGKKKQASETLAMDDQVAAKSINIRRNGVIASDSASIEITQNKSEPGINPTLLRAYQAYNAGNNIEANQLYKQVLQRDGVNVDAMLGLGAIAMRQNRAADAKDWYQKVLEIEPRNSFAQAALLQVQTNNAQQSPPEAATADESTIKSMLAKSPNDANLYASLGNLYATQKQWPSAQQAYFDAFRLNASADNAFNLAISLDQLNKPKLALPYYKQALNLTASQANGIDLNALTARIHTIESIEK